MNRRQFRQIKRQVFTPVFNSILVSFIFLLLFAASLRFVINLHQTAVSQTIVEANAFFLDANNKRINAQVVFSNVTEPSKPTEVPKTKAVVTLEKTPVSKIEFESVQKETISKLRVDTVSKLGDSRIDSVKTFAIDPTSVNFTTATVTIPEATGNALMKCKDWDFEERKCNGDWVKVRSIVQGQEYSFELTQEDPAFAEIIEITKAMHLDSKRNIISDIYPQVYALDDIWSETIPKGDYVRVTFAKNLTSSNDITIYPRIVSGSPVIEVYEVGQKTLIAEFASLNSSNYNKVLLTNLIGEQNAFDLLIKNGDVEFDHIIDPDQLASLDATTGRFFDDFESGSFATHGWTATNPWAVSTTTPIVGLDSARAAGNVKNGRLNLTIDTSGHRDIKIRFMYKIAFKTDPRLSANWYGTSWTNILYQDPATNVAATAFGANLGATANDNPNFQVLFWANGSHVSDAEFVDNVTIIGSKIYPVLSARNLSAVFYNRVRINWTTNITANTTVTYGTTRALGSVSQANDAVTSPHSRDLTSLTPNQLYYYNVSSCYKSNCKVLSGGPFTFTTLNLYNYNRNLSAVTNKTVVINWTTNKASNTSVRYGTSLALNSISAAGTESVTAHSRTLTGLLSNQLYYYNISSCDRSFCVVNNTGSFQFTTLANLFLSNRNLSAVGQNTVVINWTTNVKANTTVRYGTSLALSSARLLNNAVTLHNMTLYSLTSGQLYYYNITSCDPKTRQCKTNGSFQFTTLASLYNKNRNLSAISNVAAKINWTTNIASNTSVRYGTTLALTSISAAGAESVTLHSRSLTSLTPNQLYYYNITSCINSNCMVNGSYQFTTRPNLFSSNRNLSAVKKNSVVINWTTNLASNTSVRYGLTRALGTNRLINNALTLHNVTLFNLAPGKLYYYNITSCAYGSNCKVNGSFQFTPTPNLTISNRNLSAITATTAVVNWTTNLAANATLRYGTTVALTSSRTITSLLTFHNFTLYGLAAKQTYFYNITSCAAFGNCWTNGTYQLTTVDKVKPEVVFNKQVPPDINSNNLFGTKKLNITYNITDNVALNTGTIKLYYKTNATGTPFSIFVNGTGLGKTFTPLAYTSNITRKFFFFLSDNDVYPATYNYNQDTMESTVHSFYTLSSDNSVIKIELLNVSTTKAFGFFEVMANNTNAGGTKSLRLYYCNSSYTSGSVDTSNLCTNFYNVPAQIKYNHSDAQSSHIVIPFAINPTTGTIGAIKVTPKSYFILRGAQPTVDNWRVGYITNIARTGAGQTSTNKGNSWANLAGTVDAHLHQFNGTSRFTYYACANDTSNNKNCTSIRSDLIELGGLPPITPHIYAPISGTYFGNIVINYTAALSPNSYLITRYNITLVNLSEQQETVIKTNNTPNLGYLWNSNPRTGQFLIKVLACDNLTQCSFGLSANITIVPVISAINISAVKKNSIVINWTTNAKSNTTISYGITKSLTSSRTVQNAVTLHNVTLFNLIANKLYYFNVTSCNIGACKTNGTYSFTTIANLTISNRNLSAITNKSAVVNWTTNLASNSTIRYGTTVALTTTRGINNALTLHNFTLMNLLSGTIYYYNITSCASFGNCWTNGTYQLTTLANLFLSNKNVSGIRYSSAVINWTTNVKSNTTVKYGKTLALGSISQTNDAVTAHSRTLSSLTLGTLYYYNISSCDPKTRQCKTNGTFQFTTKPNSPPTIANLILNSTHGTNMTNENLTLHWTSNDVDGDKVVNITDWRVNNRSITILNMPFEADGKQNTTDYSNITGGITVSGAIWNDTFSHSGASYECDGTDDIINKSGVLAIGNHPFSISAWVYPERNGTGDIIVNIGTDANDLSAHFIFRQQPKICFDSFGTAAVACTGEVHAGTWYFLAGTYNGSKMRMYLDGVFQQESVQNKVLNIGSDQINICRWISQGLTYKGFIDDVRIYNRSLSADEIRQLNASDSVMHSDETIQGETWNACITPNDGRVNGASVCSNNVTIIPPGIKNVSASVTNQSAIVSWKTIAKSNGTINYGLTRSLGTKLLSSAFDYNRSLLLTGLKNHTLYYFNVTSYDKYGNRQVNGTFNFTTFQNGQPFVVNVSIKSTYGTNFTTENLTVYWVSTNINRFRIINITDWRVNNNSLMLLNMPFEIDGLQNTTDYSTNKNNGVLAGTVYPSLLEGRIGNALNFTDNNVYNNLYVSFNPIIISKNFTLIEWVKPVSSGSEYGGLFDQSDGNAGLYLRESLHKLDFFYAGGDHVADAVLNYGSWNHVVVLGKDGDIFFYINGAKDINSFSGFTGILPNRIGNDDFSEYYAGLVDEVKLFNRTLSEQQILQLYANRTDLIISNETKAGENWTACITPADKLGSGTTVCSNQIAILPATLPVVIIWVNATPNPALMNQIINFTANVTGGSSVSAVKVTFKSTNRSMTRIGTTQIYYNDTFNITNTYAGVYTYVVYANNTLGVESTPKSGTLTISAVTSMTVYNAAVNFTSGQVGSTLNAVSGHGFPLDVKNTGNVNISLNISGTNLTGNLNQIINVQNVQWDNNSLFSTFARLNYTHRVIKEAIDLAKNVSLFFRLSVPLQIKSQNFSGNITFTARSQ